MILSATPATSQEMEFARISTRLPHVSAFQTFLLPNRIEDPDARLCLCPHGRGQHLPAPGEDPALALRGRQAAAAAQDPEEAAGAKAALATAQRDPDQADRSQYPRPHHPLRQPRPALPSAHHWHCSSSCPQPSHGTPLLMTFLMKRAGRRAKMMI